MESIANNMIKSVSSGQLVPISSLWETKSLVLSFVRRWGWKFCRSWTKELSTIKPQLDSHGFGLVAVGLEELGIEEFVEGQYFTYVDFFLPFLVNYLFQLFKELVPNGPIHTNTFPKVSTNTEVEKDD